MILQGDALDLIQQESGTFGLIATDPPYAFGGSGPEHAISATVAVVLREAAQRLERGRWMLVMCAASWRSQAYMVEAVRGIVEPVRVGTWCKPKARSKVSTPGWAWASVKVIAFRKGKAAENTITNGLDHITAPVVVNGRRAELPVDVAFWMVAPFAIPGKRFLDPFAGSGRLVQAAAGLGMEAIGYEKHTKGKADAIAHDRALALRDGESVFPGGLSPESTNTLAPTSAASAEQSSAPKEVRPLRAGGKEEA